MRIEQANFSFLTIAQPKKKIAISVCILSGFLLIWEIAGAFQSEKKEILVKSAAIKTNQQKITPNSPLFTTALFGAYVPTNLSEADIKQSLLDVEIVGIMFSENGRDSQVIIHTADGEEKFYLVGDTLPGGAIIKRISQKGIVVLHNGALESLSLPKNELLFEGPAKPLIEE